MLKKLLLLLCLLPLFTFAQKPAPHLPQGFFHLDTVKIGEPVNFTFYFRHAATAEVVLPDSTFNFEPFEYVSRRFFPTQTQKGESMDSVIYTLRTFQVEPRQTLSLPAFLLQEQDTVILKSEPEIIYVKQMVRDPARAENLKPHTTLATINARLNYGYWFIGLGVLILVLCLIWMIFGKRILVRYRLYTLKLNHNQFINKYNGFIEGFNKSESLQTIEQAITLWKNYLTDLEGNAINSFTTKEIAAYYNDDEDVTTALRLFDRAIYGNIVSDKSSETIIAFYLLHHFADRRYEFIKEQTSHVRETENIPQLV